MWGDKGRGPSVSGTQEHSPGWRFCRGSWVPDRLAAARPRPQAPAWGNSLMLAMGRISQLRARPQKPHSMHSGATDAFKGQTRNHLHTQVLYKHPRGSQTLSPQNPDGQVPRRSLGFTDHLPQNTQIFDAAAFPGCTALGAQPGAQEAELTAAGLSSSLPMSFGPSSPCPSAPPPLPSDSYFTSPFFFFSSSGQGLHMRGQLSQQRLCSLQKTRG